ncbi:hypothetical protein C8R45DRAFT_944764 [Mycena sanguinolenta]|nr:hypothetical protein C8R45DRAFT_944764 [Mycena sanguinolenta]
MLKIVTKNGTANGFVSSPENSMWVHLGASGALKIGSEPQDLTSVNEKTENHTKLRVIEPVYQPNYDSGISGDLAKDFCLSALVPAAGSAANGSWRRRKLYNEDVHQKAKDIATHAREINRNKGREPAGRSRRHVKCSPQDGAGHGGQGSNAAVAGVIDCESERASLVANERKGPEDPKCGRNRWAMRVEIRTRKKGAWWGAAGGNPQMGAAARKQAARSRQQRRRCRAAGSNTETMRLTPNTEAGGAAETGSGVDERKDGDNGVWNPEHAQCCLKASRKNDDRLDLDGHRVGRVSHELYRVLRPNIKEPRAVQQPLSRMRPGDNEPVGGQERAGAGGGEEEEGMMAGTLWLESTAVRSRNRDQRVQKSAWTNSRVGSPTGHISRESPGMYQCLRRHMGTPSQLVMSAFWFSRTGERWASAEESYQFLTISGNILYSSHLLLGSCARFGVNTPAAVLSRV